MGIVFLPQAKIDLEYCKKNGNKAIMIRIITLIKDIAEHPYTGIGKPEALRYELKGKWSKRIKSEHRIIYSFSNNNITVYVFSIRDYYYVSSGLKIVRKDLISITVGERSVVCGRK